MKYIIKKKAKENKGFTLVEALIAIIILAIVSVLMVQGVKMARTAYSSNNIKTEASAMANREIEKIRSMGFDNIPIETITVPADINGFTIFRSISLVPNSNSKIKQVKIIVSNPSLVTSVKIVTEITPLEMNIAAGSTTSSSTTTTTIPATTTTVPATTTTVPATTTTVPATTTTVPATTTTAVQYPAPYDLVVLSDKLDKNGYRTVILRWQKPLNTTGTIKYNVYRNDVIINTFSSVDSTLQYTNTNFSKRDRNPYKYYIKAVYSGIESLKSNEVTTTPSN
jgi:prepilin-type N-terminal cleavage/methylation domain-containing protein